MTAEKYDNLPEEVKTILNTLDDNKNPLKESIRIEKELEKIGFLCSYGLDGEITDVEKDFLSEAMEEAKKYFFQIQHGEEIELNSKFNLYHYCEADIIVISEADGEEEEVLQLLGDPKTKEIQFFEL